MATPLFAPTRCALPERLEALENVRSVSLTVVRGRCSESTESAISAGGQLAGRSSGGCIGFLNNFQPRFLPRSLSDVGSDVPLANRGSEKLTSREVLDVGDVGRGDDGWDPSELLLDSDSPNNACRGFLLGCVCCTVSICIAIGEATWRLGNEARGPSVECVCVEIGRWSTVGNFCIGELGRSRERESDRKYRDI